MADTTLLELNSNAEIEVSTGVVSSYAGVQSGPAQTQEERQVDVHAAQQALESARHDMAAGDGQADGQDADELKEVKAAAVAAAIAADYILAETKAEHVAAMHAKDEEMVLAADLAAAELKAVQAQIRDLVLAVRKSQDCKTPALMVANETLVQSTISSVSSEKTDEQHHAAAVIQARLRQRSAERDMHTLIQAHSSRMLQMRQAADAKLVFEVSALTEEAENAQVARDDTWQQALQDGIRVQRQHLELEYASKVKDAVDKVTKAADAQVRAAQEGAARLADELVGEQSKNAKLVQQLERAKEMEHQWRGIAWKALHQGLHIQSPEDEAQTQTRRRASRKHNHGSRARVSAGSHMRYPPQLPHSIKSPKVEPTLQLPDKKTRRQLFNRIDVNGNGRISLAEIDGAVAEGILGQALGRADFDNKPALMRAYMAADTTGDNFIQRSDFSKLLSYVVYFNTYWHLFEEFDSNHDRCIDATEFAAGCTKVGMQLSAEELEREFAAFDHDGAGTILFDEWCTWCAAREYQNQRARRARLRKERSPPQRQAAPVALAPCAQMERHNHAPTATEATVTLEEVKAVENGGMRTAFVCAASVSDKIDLSVAGQDMSVTSPEKRNLGETCTGDIEDIAIQREQLPTLTAQHEDRAAKADEETALLRKEMAESQSAASTDAATSERIFDKGERDELLDTVPDVADSAAGRGRAVLSESDDDEQEIEPQRDNL